MCIFADAALKEAKISFDDGDVPVGAVIVRNGEIISKNHNRKNTDNISIYHAELLCIIDACRVLKSWHLDDCVMYVTLKPCKMCSAAIAESRIRNVYYLLDSNYSDNLDNNISRIVYNKLENSEQYKMLLSEFFEDVRAK